MAAHKKKSKKPTKKKSSQQQRKAKKEYDLRLRQEQRKTLEGLSKAITEIERNPVQRAIKTRQMLDEKMLEIAKGYLERRNDDDQHDSRGIGEA